MRPDIKLLDEGERVVELISHALEVGVRESGDDGFEGCLAGRWVGRGGLQGDKDGDPGFRVIVEGVVYGQGFE